MLDFFRKKKQGPTPAQLRYRAYLKTNRWSCIRKRRMERDGYRCQHCGSKQRLQVHHTSYEHRGDITNSSFRDELKDTITLCDPCHRKEHGLK